ncbi:hypothetical protein [Pseudomonas syringae]|uniref:hypothetical protein n=1 Tax=Pseudomonas syringae TaxID=317 RepID=UPI0011B6546D|nr:hypothetical protein [Pseudomonas syringae]
MTDAVCRQQPCLAAGSASREHLGHCLTRRRVDGHDPALVGVGSHAWQPDQRPESISATA